MVELSDVVRELVILNRDLHTALSDLANARGDDNAVETAATEVDKVLGRLDLFTKSLRDGDDVPLTDDDEAEEEKPDEEPDEESEEETPVPTPRRRAPRKR